MTPSKDIAIADAVVTVLNAAIAELVDDTIVERRILPIYKQHELTTPRIAVAPRLQAREPASRVTTDRQHIIQIAPHWRLDPTKTEEQGETFLSLMETIADIIERTGRIQRFAGASFLRMTSEPLYDNDAMQSPGVLRGIWTITFKQLASAPTAS